MTTQNFFATYCISHNITILKCNQITIKKFHSVKNNGNRDFQKLPTLLGPSVIPFKALLKLLCKRTLYINTILFNLQKLEFCLCQQRKFSSWKKFIIFTRSQIFNKMFKTHIVHFVVFFRKIFFI